MTGGDANYVLIGLLSSHLTSKQPPFITSSNVVAPHCPTTRPNSSLEALDMPNVSGGWRQGVIGFTAHN